MEEKHLATYLMDRPAQLEEARKNGVKIIGYFPGNYVPEELIYASGAVPLCLTHGGSPHPADAALSVVPHVICPFARAQIGERLLKENPYYGMIDMFVAPITCQHLKKVAEGISKEDILAGVHKALAGKIFALVNKFGLGEQCAISGGGGLNVGLIKKLEELGVKLLVPPQPQLVNALGAAIIAGEQLT